MGSANQLLEVPYHLGCHHDHLAAVWTSHFRLIDLSVLLGSVLSGGPEPQPSSHEETKLPSELDTVRSQNSGLIEEFSQRVVDLSPGGS